MHRIDGAGHVGNQFVTEDAGTSRPPTEITDAWLNAIQEEIGSVISEAGIGLNKLDNSQLIKALHKLFRNKLSANITIYVSPTGNDSNDGLSAGSPLLTIQKAWDMLQYNYDLNGFVATIQLADGIYAQGLTAFGTIAGQRSPANVVVNGNPVAPSNVFINVAVGQCIQAFFGAQLTVSNVRLAATGVGNYCLLANDPTSVLYGGSGLMFSASGAGHVAASVGGTVVMLYDYMVTGGASYHFNCSNNGRININLGIVITITGVPAFTYFALNGALGLLLCTTAVFVGAATGVRFNVYGNSVINTNSNASGLTYFPGNSAGLFASGGVYL